MRSTAAVLLVTLAICWTGFAVHPIMTALKKKTQPVSQLVGTTCPDHSLCPSDSTCCEMSQGYGCCPGLYAVCCSDGVHCCEAGYRCDLAKQACIPERNTTDSKILKFETMLSAKPNLQIRPCGVGYCEDYQTCCSPDKCCPYYSGVCCYGGDRCCPFGYHCSIDDTCKY